MRLTNFFCEEKKRCGNQKAKKAKTNIKARVSLNQFIQGKKKEAKSCQR